jgi:filamentous hemagglutinin
VAEAEGTAANQKIARQKMGWTVSDDIHAPTQNGTQPSWSTIRSRYWKNAATKADAAQRYGADNLGRMRTGLAPQRYNLAKRGVESMDLSHEPTPAREGGKEVVPRWPQDHARVDPYRRPGY